jgi:dTDP-glucose 4,6-dehydratase
MLAFYFEQTRVDVNQLRTSKQGPEFVAGILHPQRHPVHPQMADFSHRLLVTGGCGFIGSNFILRALALNCVELIVNVDALTYAGNLGNLKDVEKDERYHFIHTFVGDNMQTVMEQFDVSAIVNFASESHVDKSIASPVPFVETNVLQVTKLLESARRYWNGLSTDSRRNFCFLQISTDEVYGSLGPDDASSTEWSAFAPNSPYAASKAAADHLARSYFQTYGFPCIITRSSNNYGPRQFPEKLIPVVIAKCLSGQPIPIYGNGQQIRDWIHVNDHIDAILMLLTKGEAGSVYNIAANMERTNMETVNLICSIMDKLRPVEYSYSSLITHVRDRLGHDKRYSLNIDKILKRGWKPKVDFTKGMEDTVAWYIQKSHETKDDCKVAKCGILLAGGQGSRLYPSTRYISKHLLPVYDRPMILYSLWILHLAFQRILIVGSPRDLPMYKDLLGNGSKWNLTLEYAPQEKPEGVAQAFEIAANVGFLNPHNMPDVVGLVLGDNLLYAPNLQNELQGACNAVDGARVFACHVQDAKAFGVVIMEDDQVIGLEEKPNVQAGWAVPGIYFYDNQVLTLAKKLQKDASGELQITDLNNLYLAQKQLNVTKLLTANWIDMGTPDNLLRASNFAKQIHQDGHELGLKL